MSIGTLPFEEWLSGLSFFMKFISKFGIALLPEGMVVVSLETHDSKG